MNTHMKKKQVLLTGIQPSGHLMIGNYAGAIRNGVALQDEYDCLFMVVDLHAITVRPDPEKLRQRCYQVAGLYLACGIDPTRSTIFVQSHVSSHAELAVILNCFTQMGELNRMTQYKEKSSRVQSGANVGLFDYPVLMAADILLYQADLVPVGEDQKQHLELTRNIAGRFNGGHGEVFTVPEPYIPTVGARIMSLQDPSAKMSKSDSNANSYIGLLDSAEDISKKVARAVTDSGKEVRFDEAEKPGISNLMTIYSVVTGIALDALEAEYGDRGYGIFKKDLADAVIAFLQPIQERYADIAQSRTELDAILRDGASKAAARAESTLRHVQNCMGFIPSHTCRPCDAERESL
jgi:tryptophanyl-tRNA synthetase